MPGRVLGLPGGARRSCARDSGDRLAQRPSRYPLGPQRRGGNSGVESVRGNEGHDVPVPYPFVAHPLESLGNYCGCRIYIPRRENVGARIGQCPEGICGQSGIRQPRTRGPAQGCCDACSCCFVRAVPAPCVFMLRRITCDRQRGSTLQPGSARLNPRRRVSQEGKLAFQCSI